MTAKKPRRLRALALAGGLALGVLLLPTAGCGSLSKSDLEQELLALPKNAPVAERGLSRRSMQADLGDGEEEYELLYLHVPAADGTDPGEGPVVLVHGTPDTLFSWTPLIFGEGEAPGLSATREVVAIEVIGHGIAPGSAGGATFERCARYVNAALVALDLERVHLVGNSYGGEFVWRAALNDPERLASLTVIDSSGYPRREGDFLPEEEAMREMRLAKLGYLVSSSPRIERALAPHFEVIPEGRVDEVQLVCSNRENWRSMVELARDEDGHRADEIAQIEVPTLVVWGEQDIAYEAEWYGRQFAEDIQGAEYLVFPETGHYPHEQRREEFLAAYLQFLQGVQARR